MVLNYISGKSLWDESSNMFGIRRHPNLCVCFVATIETCVAVFKQSAIDLSEVIFIAQYRFKLYLKEAHLDDRETSDSLCAGCINKVLLSEASLVDFMSHTGCKTDGQRRQASGKTGFYYLQLSHVLRRGSATQLLSSETSEVQESVRFYRDLNCVKDYISAFSPTACKEDPPRIYSNLISSSYNIICN